MHDRLGTALFTVSRQTLDEAQDAFYEANTISIRRDIPTYWTLKLVRHLEFNSLNLEIAIRDTVGFSTYFVDSFSKLPCLQDITVSSRLLGSHLSSIRQALLENQLVGDLKYHEIGLIELIPKVRLRGKIWLRNFEVTNEIQNAQALTSSYTISELMDLYPSSAVGFVKQTRRRGPEDTIPVALWLSCYENFKAIKRGLPAAAALTPAEMNCIQEFERGVLRGAGRMQALPVLPQLHEDIPDNVPLSDMSLAAGQNLDLSSGRLCS